MTEIPDGAWNALVEGLHDVKRELAVLGERLGNERDNRDLFAVSYERRHQELQDHVSQLRVRLEAADGEREALKSSVGGLVISIAGLRRDIDGISASVRWVVYLVLGLVITALVAMVVGGALGHVKVN